MSEHHSALVQWAEDHLEAQVPEAGPEAPEYSVSVIIPSHRRVPIGLNAFRNQDCVSEVIVLANGSLKLPGEHVRQVRWQGHGKTRQDAVALASSEFILFTVDDALPLGPGCVREMVEALVDGDYEAVTGRQLPWPETDRLTRERLHNWTPPGTHHQAWSQVDHVFALYRKVTLLQHPLPDVPIGEDLHWSQNRRIGYVPTAPVFHAHPRKAKALYERTKALHAEHCRVGQPPCVPHLGAVLLSLPSVFKAGLVYGPQEIPNQLAELLGQWRGAASASKSL